ncbi:hypothetical protein [Hugenholtzia roseola]|uniref:hypothetical protein n=1 Tax=Hugenholtzia roseola TaxID=1002 RepID=UPI00040F4C25|nr:hypothetical protein [Hugenholtzia roseola]
MNVRLSLQPVFAFLIIWTSFFSNFSDARAQDRLFSVDSLETNFDNSINALFFYDWIELYNHSGRDLPLRWVRTYKDIPAGWRTQTQDIQNFHAEEIDSADFILPLENTNANFLLVHFFPNRTTDTATVILRVFPIEAPEQALTLTYVGRTRQPLALDEIATKENPLIVFPNPLQGEEKIRLQAPRKGKWQLFFQQQFIEAGNYPNPETQARLSLPPTKGIYYLLFFPENLSEVWVRKIIRL